MFTRLFLALFLSLVTLGGMAHAQKRGANGGLVVTAQGHPVEFVAKDQEIVFYVIDDDGTPMATKSFQGRAVVQDSGRTITVTLSPAEPNKLVGKLQAPLGSKARVVMSATFQVGSHKHTLQARFTTD